MATFNSRCQYLTCVKSTQEVAVRCGINQKHFAYWGGVTNRHW